MTLEGKPLHAAIIEFKDGTTLENRDIAIDGSFLIVASDYEDTLPKWYNIDTVKAIDGVFVCNARECEKEYLHFVLYPCIESDRHPQV